MYLHHLLFYKNNSFAYNVKNAGATVSSIFYVHIIVQIFLQVSCIYAESNNGFYAVEKNRYVNYFVLYNKSCVPQLTTTAATGSGVKSETYNNQQFSKC